MAVNTEINVPFIPQTGITGQILNAIQLANEHHAQNQRLAQQQQQIQLAQQAQPSEIAQRQAQTANVQAQTSSGLPQAQAAAEKSRANYEDIQGKIATENNPLVKANLQAQGRAENANASMLEARLALMKNGPGDAEGAVDSMIDPKKYPELNARTKAQMKVAQGYQAFDPEAPMKVLGQASSEVGTIERETDPNVIAARVQQAVTTQRQLFGNMGGSGLAPHLVAPATAEATKLGTDYATFQGQMKNLKDQLASAKTGDELAAQFAPIAATLGSNAFYGTHRFSPTEVESIKDVGSVPRQINAWFDKHATGTITPDSMKEFETLVDRLQGAKQESYHTGIKVLNQNYGSNFKPLDEATAVGGESSGSNPSPAAPQGKSSGNADPFAQFGGKLR